MASAGKGVGTSRAKGVIRPGGDSRGKPAPRRPGGGTFIHAGTNIGSTRAYINPNPPRAFAARCPAAAEHPARK
jgi:hypothetical protein